MTLPDPAGQLVEWAVADSVASLQAGARPFMPHLMVLDGAPDPRDRALRHTRFGPDLAAGLEQARATVGPGTAAVGYAIAWDGYATVEGNRSDAVLVEVGTPTEPAAWLLAQPYGEISRRFRSPRLERRGELLLVDRLPSRLAGVLPQWPDELGVAGLRHRLAWRSNPVPGYHKAEYVPDDQHVESFTDMLLVELHTGVPDARSWAAALVDRLAEYSVLEDGPGGVVVEFVARADGITEWNVHRYVDHPLGVVLLGVVRRRPGLGQPSDREAVIDELRGMPVPLRDGDDPGQG